MDYDNLQTFDMMDIVKNAAGGRRVLCIDDTKVGVVVAGSVCVEVDFSKVNSFCLDLTVTVTAADSMTNVLSTGRGDVRTLAADLARAFVLIEGAPAPAPKKTAQPQNIPAKSRKPVKVSVFADGTEDAYKGARDVQVGWALIHKETGSIKATGHSLDAGKAEKTARGHVPTQPVDMAFSKTAAGHRYAMQQGYKDGRDKVRSIKARNAEMQNEYRVEVVELTIR